MCVNTPKQKISVVHSSHAFRGNAGKTRVLTENFFGVLGWAGALRPPSGRGATCYRSSHSGWMRHVPFSWSSVGVYLPYIPLPDLRLFATGDP